MEDLYEELNKDLTNHGHCAYPSKKKKKTIILIGEK